MLIIHLGVRAEVNHAQNVLLRISLNLSKFHALFSQVPPNTCAPIICFYYSFFKVYLLFSHSFTLNLCKFNFITILLSTQSNI